MIEIICDDQSWIIWNNLLDILGFYYKKLLGRNNLHWRQACNWKTNWSCQLKNLLHRDHVSHTKHTICQHYISQNKLKYPVRMWNNSRILTWHFRMIFVWFKHTARKTIHIQIIRIVVWCSNPSLISPKIGCETGGSNRKPFVGNSLAQFSPDASTIMVCRALS